MRCRARRAFALVLFAGCAGGGALPAGEGLVPAAVRAERIVIGTHADISAVAASRAHVFAATPDALLVYDLARAAWLPPLSRQDGYPGGPVTAAADPVEEGVWLVAQGSVLYYRPHVELLTSTVLPGIADALFFDRRDPGAGAYVRSGGTWVLVSRTGASMPVGGSQLPPAGAREHPSTLADVYRQYPGLRSFVPLLTRDVRLRSWPVSSGARAPDRDEVYLGTRGNGLYRVDPLFQRAEHLPYGLLEQGAASIGNASDGVWIGGVGRAPGGRGGVTYASHDLQRWLWLEGQPGRPLGAVRVNAVSSHENLVWLATERGVIRLSSSSIDDGRLWTMREGLPSDDVLSVLPGIAGTWIGTARGLAFLPSSAAEDAPIELRTFGVTSAVRALRGAGERMWIGSDAGLLVITGSDPSAGPERAAAADQEPRLRRPIRALAASDSVLFAATRDELFGVDLRTGELIRVLAGEHRVSVRGDITSLAADSETLWVGGSDGVTVIMRATGATRELRPGRDLPGAVNGIAIAPGLTWIATARGVVRVTRAADGGIR